ncbi:MAG: DNA-processing protein DprA [Christensenellales bacterium]
MHSILALKLYGMIKQGIIKSNAMFWRDFFDEEKINSFDVDLELLEKELQDKDINLICVFDDKFPKTNLKLKLSEKPFLLVYKGNIDLLNKINNNVAVIGVLTPTADIIVREQKIIEELVKNNLTIVSGLAKGCDAIAHKTSLENKGKTIAILPTTFDNIYPKENKSLVNKIVKNNGLVITEYIIEAQNKYERIKRFIERDRLQAMFSNAVILVASYTQGNGDSGSRHAMQKAKEYGKARYVMFDEKTDNGKSIFELNKAQIADGATILTNKTIKELTTK